MAETMVRASGGYSKQNLDDAKRTGYENGIAEAKRGTTAEPNHVLDGMIFTTYDAVRTYGRMPNRGATNIVVPNRLSNPNNPTKIPAGYHNGNGEVTVAAPSGTKTLAANQISNVDLTPYDYKYVDASAVYEAGKSAGVVSTGENVNDLAKDESYTFPIINSSNYSMDIILSASLSRPRGDGYSRPAISVPNATQKSHESAEYSSTNVQTNVSMAVDVYTIPARTTVYATITATEKAGVLSYSIVRKSA